MPIPSLVLLLVVQVSATAPAPAEEVAPSAVPADAVAPIDDTDQDDDDDEDAAAPGADRVADDDGTRPVRDDLPATAAVSPKAALKTTDPAFPIWWRSVGLLCGAEGAALLGGLPALVVLGLGGTCINDAGDRVSGRHGTWLTSVALVGAGVGVLGIGAASVLIGGLMYIDGSGGLGPLLSSREDPFRATAGVGIMVAGLVGGPAIGAILPTWTYLATAEPVPE